MFEKARVLLSSLKGNVADSMIEEAHEELSEAERQLEEVAETIRTQGLKDGVSVLTSGHAPSS